MDPLQFYPVRESRSRNNLCNVCRGDTSQQVLKIKHRDRRPEHWSDAKEAPDEKRCDVSFAVRKAAEHQRYGAGDKEQLDAHTAPAKKFRMRGHNQENGVTAQRVYPMKTLSWCFLTVQPACSRRVCCQHGWMAFSGDAKRRPCSGRDESIGALAEISTSYP